MGERMLAGVTRLTNELFIVSEGLDSIHNAIFDFNIDSEVEEDEVFVGDVGFLEKCKSAVVDDMCNANSFQELTDEQWVHMKENADLMVFHLWRSKLENFDNTLAAVAVTKMEPNVKDQNSPLKSKRKMISSSPYKAPPLQDITNRSVMKPSPLSIQKLATSSKLNISTDFAIYDQFDLLNPMRLNFDDVEHSPKKSQCLNPYFNCENSPLITDEAGNDLLLLSSPTLKQVSAVRNSLNHTNRSSLDAMKSRLRTKTYKLDEGKSIFPSPLRPNISSCNAKESQTLTQNHSKSLHSEAEPKPPRKSLLNVSFTIDKDVEMLLRMDSPVTKTCENVNASQEPTLNESFTINKSYVCDSTGGKPSLNASFTINKSIVRDSLNARSTSDKSFSFNESLPTRNSMNGKGALNLSSTINKSVKRESLNEKIILNKSFTIDKSNLDGSVNKKPSALKVESFVIDETLSVKEAKKTPILNESFTINDSEEEVIPTKKPILNESFIMNESQNKIITKTPTLNESFTINDSEEEVIPTKKPILNESFIMNESQNKVITKTPTLNESFTINDSEEDVIPTKKPILNESFIMNESQNKEVITKTPILNESFTMKESQNEEVSCTKKPILNKSLTLEDPQMVEVVPMKNHVLNESFSLEKSSVDAPVTCDAYPFAGKTSTPIRENTLKKKSPPDEKANSLKSLYNKSTISDKSCNSFQKDLGSRKRALASVIKAPTQQRSEPPHKTSVVNSIRQNKSGMPAIKSSIVPKVSVSRLQPVNFTLKKPNLNFNASTPALQKDNHGMVKFQEKSVVPVKALKSSLMVPTKLTRKSLKVSPQKTIPKKLIEPKIQSPVMGLKRKCIQSTPPLSKISYAKPTQSNINSNGVAMNTRLAFPSKLSSIIPRSDKIRQLPQSETQSKGPYKSLTSSGNGSEIKKSNFPLAGKSKLKMPSPLSRPSQISYKKT